MSIKEITCNLLKIVKTGKYCLYCNEIRNESLQIILLEIFLITPSQSLSCEMCHFHCFIYPTSCDVPVLIVINIRMRCQRLLFIFIPLKCVLADCSMHFNEIPWFYISLSVVGMTILDIWSVKIVMDPFDGEKIGRGLSY